jgi:alpha-D-ribose 1-methylphosphonate 5-triphosphate synthase subunit PhnH
MSLDASSVSAGFDDPAMVSQAVFREALAALARPGTLHHIDADLDVAAPALPAAGALMLALLDQDTTVWLSPSLAQAPCAAWLRFHTGCRVTSDPASADFAWVSSVDECPSLDAFSHGTEEFPDRSTTVVIQMGSVADGGVAWRLRGPGVNGDVFLNLDASSATLVKARAALHAVFPRGVDIFFADRHRVVGLPRSTRIGV